MRKQNKTILKCFLTVICLCIAFYLFITSSFVLKLILEPVLRNLFGFTVTVEEIHYSPFTSMMKFKNLKMGYQNAPFVEGRRGSCKINSLSDLLLRKISFSDVNLDSPTFRAVKFENEKWNFPWMYRTDHEKATEPLVHLNFPNINIKNGKVIFEIKRKNPEHSSKVTFYKLDIKSPLFANNHQARIDIKGSIKISSGKEIQVENGDISGSVLSYFDEWTKPNTLLMDFSLKDVEGKINNLCIKNNSVKLFTDIYTEGDALKIRDFSFSENHGGKIATDISVTGYFNTLLNKGNLNIKAIPVSNEILNIFSGVFANYNFGNMKLYYNGNIKFNADSLSNVGKLIINDFQINKNINSSHLYKIPYDINFDYKLNYIYKSKILRLDSLNSFFSKNLVDQKGHFNFEHANKSVILLLNKPVFLKFNKSKVELIGKKARGKIILNNLDIRFLNSFLINFPYLNLFSGKSNGVFDFIVNPESNEFVFRGKFNTDNLSYKLGKLTQKNTRIATHFDCRLKDFRILHLNPFSGNISRNEEEILKYKINGKIDFVDHIIKLEIFIPLLKNNILNYFPNSLKENKVIKKIIDQLKLFHLTALTNIYLNVKERRGSIGNAKISLNKAKYKNATLQLKNYIPFTWTSEKLFLEKDIPTHFQIENVNLSFFNTFLPYYSPFNFTNGLLNLSINCFFERDLNTIKVDGKVNMPSFGIRIRSNKFNDIDLNAIYNFQYDVKNKNFVFDKTNIVLDKNKKNALSLGSSGSYNFKNGILLLNGNIFNINKNILKFFPSVYTDNINQLAATGDLNIKVSPDNKSIYTMLKFNKMSYYSLEEEKEIMAFGYGTVVLDASLKNKKAKIERILINFKKHNEIIFNLALDGSLAIPLYSGKSLINITSNKSYPGFAQELVEAFSKDADAVGIHKNYYEEKNLPTIKNTLLENMDFTGNIKLDNIILTTQTKGKVNAVATLKNRKLRITAIEGFVNKSPFKASVLLDLQYLGIYPYSFKVNCSKISVSDLLNVLDIEDNKIRGNVSNLDMHISGVDKPFSQSHYKALKGYLKIDASDVKLPVNLSRYGIFKIMFIPIELLSRIRQMIPIGLTSSSIKNTLTSTSKIFNKKTEISFKNAQISVQANNNIMLKKVLFTGAHDDFVRLMKFNGKIYLNKNIDIDAYSDITGLRFPLEIYGTIDNPDTDTQKFLYNFMKENAINIFNPNNLVDLINDMGIGIKKTFNNAVNSISTPVPD